jgi:Glyoxalase-like domain
VLAIDHVVVVVADLDAAARRYQQDYGLASVAGGRHPGHGTANRIVPLGGSYIELMAVVDRAEAAASPLGTWAEGRRASAPGAPALLCLRANDIEATAGRVGDRPSRMTRTRPDGVELVWHLVGLDAALGDGLPFFIQWSVPDRDHPGRASVDHPRAPDGIDWVELGGDERRLAAWLGPHDLPIRHVTGSGGPRRLALGLADNGQLLIA